MDRYVIVEDCDQIKASLKSRIKWLGWILVMVLGVTAITAEEAWRARAGFDKVNSQMERQSGITETQVKGIQRSLDRIDRRLEQQEAILHQVLRANGL